ncbi:Phox-associated domain-containing protein [Dichotomocladium elegans]|nr:Phox-associated domain-containing protein [Dichotomocladium elegans]
MLTGEENKNKQVDWTELIMISAANLLSIHYQDYRQAKMRLHMSHAGHSVTLEALFHGMQPHFALMPPTSPSEQQEHQQQEYLRALTDAILRTVLEPRDYNSDCVRHLVRELVANLVLGNIVELLADPYVIHMIICKVCFWNEWRCQCSRT